MLFQKENFTISFQNVSTKTNEHYPNYIAHISEKLDRNTLLSQNGFFFKKVFSF